ncbi:hypothetical protein [Pelomonas sp. SE-A7]|uniref:substrate-binding periplasmic protein n=1 Tax=Pelomonas sp. SE-A7 TaxID=3054953 RepID=UPI00259CC2B3|nr:hypothetical protein [Pelomonas sp. SE-A7]MDM4764925.1 hypothetical protein [Pelomonas sp. SE-A7]
MHPIGKALILLSAWAACARAQADEQRLAAYNTYAYPPFVEADGSGLAQDLVDALNRQLQGRYRFKLHNLPRIQLVRRTLADPAGFEGVVLFLNPSFVDDASLHRWHWSAKLFEDRNLLVFRNGEAPTLDSLKPLEGLRFGSMLGSRYPALDAMLAEGRLKKDSSTSATDLLRALCNRRVDFLQMNTLSYAAMAALPEFVGRVMAVEFPGRSQFSRHLMLRPGQHELAKALDEALPRLRCDARWSGRLRTLGIDPPACSSP